MVDNHMIETDANGTITVKTSLNTRTLYDHQIKAMACMDIINKNKSYSTLIVLPTGSGKTYTAAVWLMKNALNNNKKILWIAHRQYLLDQAAETFKKYPFSDILSSVSSFNYRIISGSDEHDKPKDIKSSDDLLLVSKDSIGRNLKALDIWLKGEEEIYFVIDEAHHSTAKTYRKVIDYIKEHIKNVKLIGLTATPFRTAENEKTLLSRIYTDGVVNNKYVHNASGIAYEVSLKELIAKGILSRPHIESHNTSQDYSRFIGSKELEMIQRFDTLPEKLTEEMIKNSPRNKFIVDTYKKNKDKYEQTIVFAVNIPHALELSALFNDAGIKADFVVSDIKDLMTHANRSKEDNERVMQLYRDKELDVLVNVNILTEGVDFPGTKTVFLTRQTVSRILMTQMVGRALRGEKAFGTKDAYIVSFVDNGLEKIPWSNPEMLFDVNSEFSDSETDCRKRDIRYIAVSKIEEFARMLNNSADTSELEKIPFTRRIPIGMYVFSYEDGIDVSCQVMVYDSTKDSYEKMMKELPVVFSGYNIEGDIADETVKEIAQILCDKCFEADMIPSYEYRDIESIVRYYDQEGEVPPYRSFDDIDRNKIDVCVHAEKIVKNQMSDIEKVNYINALWDDSDDEIIRLFFGAKKYLFDQLNREILRILSPELFDDSTSNVIKGNKSAEDMSLYQLKKHYPELAAQITEAVFTKARTDDGKYKCQNCGKTFKDKLFLQVDHIVPRAKGGKTVVENLQVLCRSCNGRKGDK